METELRTLARAYKALAALREQTRKLEQHIAMAEAKVLEKLAAQPPGTMIPVKVPEHGRIYRFTAGVDRVWSPTDWNDVYAFVKANNRFDVLQRRLNSGVVAELHARGEAPWAVHFDRPKLMVRTSAYVPD